MDQAPQNDMESLGEQAIDHALKTSMYLMCMAFIEKVLRGDIPPDPEDRTLKVQHPEGNDLHALKLLDASEDAIMLVKDEETATLRGGKKNKIYPVDWEGLNKKKCSIVVIDDASLLSDARRTKIRKALESCQPVYIEIG